MCLSWIYLQITLSLANFPICINDLFIHVLSESAFFPFTCSYDEMLRVWDTRSLARPVGEHATGGGVWRIKPHPIDPTLLLLVAMYNRFHVIKWDLKHSSSKTLSGLSLSTLVPIHSMCLTLWIFVLLDLEILFIVRRTQCVVYSTPVATIWHTCLRYTLSLCSCNEVLVCVSVPLKPQSV